ncbi:MAG: pyridoxal-phosphate dependent enzyme, partial [Sphingomonadales bacterium]|nr:pyridoxal-phosphate dependent enzyme [Sphingomonadales bacterium]
MKSVNRPSLPISYDDVVDAHARIRSEIIDTPATASKTLSQITGADVFLKFESFQFTASFKERGALNRLLHLTEEERKRGVIAMSAGNHAQGV